MLNIQGVQNKPRGRTANSLDEKLAKLQPGKVLDVSKITPTGTGVTTINEPKTTKSTKIWVGNLRIASSDLEHYLMAIDQLEGGRTKYANNIAEFNSRLSSPSSPTKASISPKTNNQYSIPPNQYILPPQTQNTIPTFNIASPTPSILPLKQSQFPTSPSKSGAIPFKPIAFPNSPSSAIPFKPVPVAGIPSIPQPVPGIPTIPQKVPVAGIPSVAFPGVPSVAFPGVPSVALPGVPSQSYKPLTPNSLTIKPLPSAMPTQNMNLNVVKPSTHNLKNGFPENTIIPSKPFPMGGSNNLGLLSLDSDYDTDNDTDNNTDDDDDDDDEYDYDL